MDTSGLAEANIIWLGFVVIAVFIGLLIAWWRAINKNAELAGEITDLAANLGLIGEGLEASGKSVVENARISVRLISDEFDRLRNAVENAAVAEQKYRNIVVHAPVCIHEIDTSGRLRSMNPAGLEMMGENSFEVLDGVDYMSIPMKEDRPNVSALFQDAVGGEPSEFEFRVNTSGHEATFLSRFSPVFDASGQVLEVVGMTIDVTEHRRLEEQLRRTQRIESIGTLTGGVAHDFNNLLSVILGNLELALEGVTDKNLTEHIQNAVDATLSGADLTRNMLAYARKAPLEPEVIDLNDLVRSSKNWISRTVPANIAIETSLLGGLWRCHVDETSATNALLNLIVNAQDSMPEGGVITLETANIRIDNDYLEGRGEDIEPGRYVLLAVSDTGTGIKPEDLDRIFEPFYTTKDPGAGTGLGLAMIMGFLKQSGGTVRVYSELGVGTTFKLYFPAVHDEYTLQRRSKKRIPERSMGNKRILVADDNEGVLGSLATMISKAGFAVESVTSGDEAAEIFIEDPSFDLLVTDVVMSGELQGPELAAKVREIRPDLPIVFMTGYASEATVHGNGLLPDDIRLMKPVRRSDLLEAIQVSLSQSQKEK